MCIIYYYILIYINYMLLSIPVFAKIFLYKKKNKKHRVIYIKDGENFFFFFFSTFFFQPSSIEIALLEYK